MRRSFLSLMLFTVGACGGSDAGTTDLTVAWSFPSGDCATNGIKTVRVAWTAPGTPQRSSDFPCTALQGKLGTLTKGSHAIAAEGLDGGGVARMGSTLTATFPDGKAGGPVTFTLRPKSSNVVVTWNGCPRGVILPYFISLYPPPAMPGGPLANRIKMLQESCTAGRATLESVAPGDYVVELDSRAVTPRILATKPVTVVAGENASVAMGVP
jgi:hypothetical protein